MATNTKALYLRAETRFKDADSFLFEMQHTFGEFPRHGAAAWDISGALTRPKARPGDKFL